MVEHLLVHLFNLLRTLLAKAARRLRRKIRTLGKDRWVEVEAKIDVVSVVDWPEPSEFVKTYFGVLTYFYRNPDLHTGDYELEFDDRWQAQNWVNHFKGLDARVRVNPRDPDDSVLLELPICPPIKARPPARTYRRSTSTVLPKPVLIRALSPGQRTWAENCRLISAASIGASAIVLLLNITTGGQAYSKALFWLGGLLLTFVFCSLGILSFVVTVERSFRSVRRLYAVWGTRNMAGLSIASGVILAVLFLYSADRMQFPAEARAKVGTHLPYIGALWGFLVSWSLHGAILRSQQNLPAQGQGHPRRS